MHIYLRLVTRDMNNIDIVNELLQLENDISDPVRRERLSEALASKLIPELRTNKQRIRY